MIHNHTANSGEDVTADQRSLLIEAIASIGPLFNPCSIAQRFRLQWFLQFIIVFNFSVETNPDPIVETNAGVVESVDDIVEACKRCTAIAEFRLGCTGLQGG